MESGKKILVPVDFSVGSERAVEKAAELARVMDASVELMHVYQLPVFALPDSSVTVSPTYIADLTDRAQRALEKHRELLAADGIEASTKLMEGMPAQAIVDHANEISAEMIVMGTHGHSGFKRFLLGSTAERVVRMATVPVLSVHLPHWPRRGPAPLTLPIPVPVRSNMGMGMGMGMGRFLGRPGNRGGIPLRTRACTLFP